MVKGLSPCSLSICAEVCRVLGWHFISIMHWLLLCQLLDFSLFLCANKSRALTQQREMQCLTSVWLRTSLFKYEGNKKGLRLRHWFASSGMPLCLHRSAFDCSARRSEVLGQRCCGQTAKGANDRVEESLIERWANTSEGRERQALEMKLRQESRGGGQKLW